ncbi:RXLR domain-containing protein [Phytophthora infestans]|uniref:RxLR effector protein n=1 Tax=Phytophthora infestans TaxID=4787 RepID=A0A833T8H2_PHYIN|nr:RXLR domain-containing protein [Phytophthora infestans]
MRVPHIVLVTAVYLLSSCNAQLPAEVISKLPSHQVDAVASDVNRMLRSHKPIDNGNSEGEERAKLDKLVSDLALSVLRSLPSPSRSHL